jgi:putative salt-induced outer membrane protein
MKLAMTSMLAFLCLASAASADVVTLKNGDRVTGTLVTIKGGTLQLKSDILGDLSIPMAKVATYTADKPVAVVIKGKEPIQGTLELTPSGDWQVKANGQQQTIAAATVDTIMPADAFQKLVVVKPAPWKAWKGSATLGESLQRGNQQTSNFTTTIDAVRERPDSPIFQRHSRTNFTAAALLAHAEEAGGTPGSTINVTSHTLSGNVREDYLFSPKMFVFGLGQLDHISTEGLYLRQTVGGGFGDDVIKNSHTTFSLLGGLTYQHEKFFDGSFTHSADGLVGEKLGEQFTKRIRLDHTLTFYPNFSQGGEFRFDTSTVLSMKIFNRFSLNTGVVDLYLSNPPPGNHQNNITFSTGIGYSF